MRSLRILIPVYEVETHLEHVQPNGNETLFILLLGGSREFLTFAIS